MRGDPDNALPVLLAMNSYRRKGNQNGLQAMARQFLLSGMRGLSLEIEPSTSGRGAA
jgi:hypothetical protein